MLLIVMLPSGTWRARPGETLTSGRETTARSGCLPGTAACRARRAASPPATGPGRRATTVPPRCCTCTGTGFRADLPPGTRIPLSNACQAGLQGVLDRSTLRRRLPDLDDLPGQDGAPGHDDRPPAAPGPPRRGEPPTSTSYHARLTGSGRLALAARFEEHLSWRHEIPPGICPAQASNTK